MPACPDSRTALATADDLARADYADTRDRALGFLDVYGPEAPIAVAAEPDVEQGARAARLLLDVPPDRRPTAVVAQSDLLAMGVVRTAGELGLEPDAARS